MNMIKEVIFLYLRHNHLSLRRFAAFIQMSEETIRRMYNKPYPSYQTELPNVVAVCLGLHMDPITSTYILNLSGHSLTNSREDDAYRYLLTCCYKDPIEKDNHYLLDHDLTALTKKL